MTYEGRWTYKYEEAGRRNADAVFIVHSTEAAGYPWRYFAFHLLLRFALADAFGSVVRTGRLEPSLKVRPKDDVEARKDKCIIEGWLTEGSARKIFAAASLDFDAEKAAAGKRGFTAKSLGSFKATVSLKTQLTALDSRNVLALVEGASREVVVFTAHWDHFGLYSDGSGKIYHGARDNALGVAALLALAAAFNAVPREFRKRSVLFLVRLMKSIFCCLNSFLTYPDNSGADG